MSSVAPILRARGGMTGRKGVEGWLSEVDHGGSRGTRSRTGAWRSEVRRRERWTGGMVSGPCDGSCRRTFWSWSAEVSWRSRACGRAGGERGLGPSETRRAARQRAADGAPAHGADRDQSHRGGVPPRSPGGSRERPAPRGGRSGVCRLDGRRRRFTPVVPGRGSLPVPARCGTGDGYRAAAAVTDELRSWGATTRGRHAPSTCRRHHTKIRPDGEGGSPGCPI
jgi:hypothetical protein